MIGDNCWYGLGDTNDVRTFQVEERRSQLPDLFGPHPSNTPYATAPYPFARCNDTTF